MKIAIIPTTGGEDPFRGMEIAVKLGVEGVHIPAYGGKLNLAGKTREERIKVRERIQTYGLEVSALIGWGGEVDLGEEKNLRENIEKGKILNETAVDIANGLWMAHVDIMEMVDKKSISEALAVEIVRNTYDKSRFERSQEAMRERAQWVIGLDRERRKYATEALKELGHKASIADLNNYVEEGMEQSKLTVQYTIPVELHSVLLKWGKERGLKDESTIVSFMITEVLNKGAR